jgi:hypothetical protein
MLNASLAQSNGGIVFWSCQLASYVFSFLRTCEKKARDLNEGGYNGVVAGDNSAARTGA